MMFDGIGHFPHPENAAAWPIWCMSICAPTCDPSRHTRRNQFVRAPGSPGGLASEVPRETRGQFLPLGGDRRADRCRVQCGPTNSVRTLQAN